VVGLVDTELAEAARSGDVDARDALVAECLPLVYSIVRRSLRASSDVDDVVQDVMLNVVRSLGSLRDPERLRAWLAAVTVNQIRAHLRSGRAESLTVADRFEPFDRPDPSSEFVGHTLLQLDLSDQRRETARAANWLDPEHRDLLGLWWLEASGHLTRAELTAALGLDPHLVTMRVARMKEQLDGCRQILRALDAGCTDLMELAADWRGETSSVWRKRFIRHVRACPRCAAATDGRIAPERLLAGLPLLPLPLAYLGPAVGGAGIGGAGLGGAHAGSGYGASSGGGFGTTNAGSGYGTGFGMPGGGGHASGATGVGSGSHASGGSGVGGHGGGNGTEAHARTMHLDRSHGYDHGHGSDHGYDRGHDHYRDHGYDHDPGGHGHGHGHGSDYEHGQGQYRDYDRAHDHGRHSARHRASSRGGGAGSSAGKTGVAALLGKPIGLAATVLSVLGVAAAVVIMTGRPATTTSTAQAQPTLQSGPVSTALASVGTVVVPTGQASRGSASAATSPTHAASHRASASAHATHPAVPAKSSTAASSGSQSPAEQVLAVINQARASAGLPAYKMSADLIKSATAHNNVMANGCGLSHQCSGEAAIGDRETAAGVHWTACGENIGEGGPEPDTQAGMANMAVSLTDDMLAEKPPNDGHRLNILSSSFTEVGIAITIDSSGTVWMTQDFAN